MKEKKGCVSWTDHFRSIIESSSAVRCPHDTSGNLTGLLPDPPHTTAIELSLTCLYVITYIPPYFYIWLLLVDGAWVKPMTLVWFLPSIHDSAACLHSIFKHYRSVDGIMQWSIANCSSVSCSWKLWTQSKEQGEALLPESMHPTQSVAMALSWLLSALQCGQTHLETLAEEWAQKMLNMTTQ